MENIVGDIKYRLKSRVNICLSLADLDTIEVWKIERFFNDLGDEYFVSDDDIVRRYSSDKLL